MGNPKRSSLVAGFFGVTAILCVRTMLNGPASAPASVIRAPNQIVNESGTAHEPRNNQRSNALLDWLAQPKHPLTRNLFGSKLNPEFTEPKNQPVNLELQTTIMQDPPRAMVNGQLLHEGDIIEGFTILKIQPRRILVQQDGPPIEIDMP